MLLIFIVIFISCKNTSEKTQEAINLENKKEVIDSESEEANTDKTEEVTIFSLNKESYWKTEMFPNLTYYAAKEEPVSFHCSGKYGVLEYYLDDGLVTDYYIFEAPLKMEEELIININDTLFSMTEKELNTDMSGFYTITNNYLLISDGGGSDQSYLSIIDLDKQIEIEGFNSFGEIGISADGNILSGWQQTDTKVNKDTVCPEYIGTETYDNYEVTQQVQYNLKTEKITKTGKLGCSFIQ